MLNNHSHIFVPNLSKFKESPFSRSRQDEDLGADLKFLRSGCAPRNAHSYQLLRITPSYMHVVNYKYLTMPLPPSFTLSYADNGDARMVEHCFKYSAIAFIIN